MSDDRIYPHHPPHYAPDSADNVDDAQEKLNKKLLDDGEDVMCHSAAALKANASILSVSQHNQLVSSTAEPHKQFHRRYANAPPHKQKEEEQRHGESCDNINAEKQRNGSDRS